MQKIDPSIIHPALSDLIGQLADVGVDKVILYGSRARGDHTDRADIDLCIDAEVMDSVGWDKVQQSVEQAQTLLAIDTVHWQRLSDYMRRNIMKDGKVLYEKR